MLQLLVSAKWKKALFFISNTVISFLLFSSLLYHSHFGTMVTYKSLSNLHQVPQVRESIQTLLDWKYIFFFADLFMFIIIKLFFYLSKQSTDLYANHTSRRYTTVMSKKVTGVLTVLACVINGFLIFQGVELENEKNRAQKLGFINYQLAEVILNARQSTEISLQQTIHQAKVVQKKHSPFKHIISNHKKHFGAGKGSNVIIVQLESFQNFPLHKSLDGQELTPVLNALSKECLYFPHFFHQVGKGNTSDAEFMLNTSIYPTGKDKAMSEQYCHKNLPSLPKLLREHGYTSFTLHVNEATFWNRVNLYAALAFDRYFDKPFFRDDKFNVFGASDEELYRVGIEKIVQQQQSDNKPLCAQFIACASHHPFKVPTDKIHIRISEKNIDPFLRDYLTSMNYADYAVGQLVQQLKQKGLWEKTTFIVYGDHCGLTKQDEDLNKSLKDLLGIRYDTPIHSYNIPLLIHMPGQTKGQVIDHIGGQVDLLPTLINILGISPNQENFYAFGHDLLNINENVIGLRYYLPAGSFINNKVFYKAEGETYEEGTAYSLQTNEVVTDLNPYRKDYEYIKKWMKLSDQYLQALPEREKK